MSQAVEVRRADAGWFRPWAFAVGFMGMLAPFLAVSKLNDIQANFESTGPVGLIALGSG